MPSKRTVRDPALFQVMCPSVEEIFRAARRREAFRFTFVHDGQSDLLFPDALKWETKPEALQHTLRIEGLHRGTRVCVLTDFNPKTRTAQFKQNPVRKVRR